MKNFGAALISTLLLFGTGCVHEHRRPAEAGIPGAHPAYVHALEDLRVARMHLERTEPATRQTAWDESVAIREIDAAIHEVREAAIDDGKEVNRRTPVDARMDWPGRMHRALELLHRARADCLREEDNNYARDLQQRALHHIDAAIAYVDQGIRANHW